MVPVASRRPRGARAALTDCTHAWCIDLDLTIADCSRIVSLAFEIGTAAERRNRLHKVDTLIDALGRRRT